MRVEIIQGQLDVAWARIVRGRVFFKEASSLKRCSSSAAEDGRGAHGSLVNGFHFHEDRKVCWGRYGGDI